MRPVCRKENDDRKINREKCFFGWIKPTLGKRSKAFLPKIFNSESESAILKSEAEMYSDQLDSAGTA
jgi:hypothetical protein